MKILSLFFLLLFVSCVAPKEGTVLRELGASSMDQVSFTMGSLVNVDNPGTAFSITGVCDAKYNSIEYQFEGNSRWYKRNEVDNSKDSGCADSKLNVNLSALSSFVTFDPNDVDRRYEIKVRATAINGKTVFDSFHVKSADVFAPKAPSIETISDWENPIINITDHPDNNDVFKFQCQVDSGDWFDCHSGDSITNNGVVLNYNYYGKISVRAVDGAGNTSIINTAKFSKGAPQNGFNSTVNDVVHLDNGNIVVAGSMTKYQPVYSHPIIFADSDFNFDYNTKLTSRSFGGSSPNIEVSKYHNPALYVWKNDLSQYNGVSVPKIIRLNKDGSQDQDYITNIKSINIASIYYFVEDSETGAIYLGITTSDSENKTIKINYDGSVDSSFVFYSYGSMKIVGSSLQVNTSDFTFKINKNTGRRVAGFTPFKVDGNVVMSDVDESFLTYSSSSTPLNYFSYVAKTVNKIDFDSSGNAYLLRGGSILKCSSLDNLSDCNIISYDNSIKGFSSLFIDKSTTPNRLFVFSLKNDVSMSTDGGETFTILDAFGDKVMIDSSGVIYIGSGTGTKKSLYISVDNGLSFVKKDGLYSNVNLGPDDEVYYVDSYIYRSINKGASFQRVYSTSLFSMHKFLDVSVLGSRYIFIASSGGLLVSSNGGASFVRNTNAPSNIYDVHVMDNTIFLSTLSGGIYISTDGGSSFIQKTTADGLLSNSFRENSFFELGGKLLIKYSSIYYTSIGVYDGSTFSSFSPELGNLNLTSFSFNDGNYYFSTSYNPYVAKSTNLSSSTSLEATQISSSQSYLIKIKSDGKFDSSFVPSGLNSVYNVHFDSRFNLTLINNGSSLSSVDLSGNIINTSATLATNLSVQNFGENFYLVNSSNLTWVLNNDLSVNASETVRLRNTGFNDFIAIDDGFALKKADTLAGEDAGQITVIKSTSGEVVSKMSASSGSVYSIAAYDGKFFISGSFSDLNGSTTSNLAKFDSEFNLDQSFSCSGTSTNSRLIVGAEGIFHWSIGGATLKKYSHECVYLWTNFDNKMNLASGYIGDIYYNEVENSFTMLANSTDFDGDAVARSIFKVDASDNTIKSNFAASTIDNLSYARLVPSEENLIVALGSSSYKLNGTLKGGILIDESGSATEVNSDFYLGYNKFMFDLDSYLILNDSNVLTLYAKNDLSVIGEILRCNATIGGVKKVGDYYYVFGAFTQCKVPGSNYYYPFNSILRLNSDFSIDHTIFSNRVISPSPSP